MASQKPYGTVLIKASVILDSLSQSSDPLGTKDIAEMSELTLSTTSKILETLESIGYVKRDLQTKKYSLGGSLIHLASASFMQFDIVRESYPALKRLNQKFDETVHLGMFQDNRVLYINKLSAKKYGKKMISRIGYTQDLYCSAMGKAMLSTFEQNKLNHYMDEIAFNPRTEQTITQNEELINQLEDIQEKEYAIDNRESEEHVYCVGATVKHLRESENTYAFSISVPYQRVTENFKQEMVESVLKTKNIIEFQLESQTGSLY